ncbi:MAG: nitroreductase family protein [Deltaproteobacteria bacterium]|nr:MAG: nitroreductase family protein [Deltaproteobacteria bacterium]
MRRIPPPPEIDSEKCNGCGLCVKVCPALVLVMQNDLPKIERAQWCIGCGHCGAVCPVDAVVQKETAVESHLTVGPDPAVNPEALQQLLRERRSVRFYKPKEVPKEVLEKIINAGRYAPTGGNSQNVHYLVLTTPGEITRLRELTLSFLERSFRIVGNRIGALWVRLVAGFRALEKIRDYEPGILDVIKRTKQGEDRLLWNAPAVIAVHAPAWDQTSAFNCVSAIYCCSLMAHSLGVGTCFNGFIEHSARHDRTLKKFLGIPKDHHCFGAMTLGYQDIKFKHLVERRKPNIEWR